MAAIVVLSANELTHRLRRLSRDLQKRRGSATRHTENDLVAPPAFRAPTDGGGHARHHRRRRHEKQPSPERGRGGWENESPSDAGDNETGSARRQHLGEER